mmetsp:Transcript_9596/g.14732  ORF Transcript_9596/g.14732 Transcript_9596/m.14732 type:complete len:267 (-) Transcript_9596:271-1071(-)
MQRRVKLAQEKDGEAREERQRWMEEQRKEDKQNEQRRMETMARGQEIRQFNAMTELRRAEQAELAKKQDLMLLQYALDKERADEANEKMKKAEERHVIAEYNDYRKEQMIHEAENNEMVDMIRKQEEDKIWEQREAELQRQEEARMYLMSQVDAGRQEQIAARRQMEDSERRLNQEQAMREKLDYELMEEAERKRVMARKMANVENAQRLKSQMDSNQARLARVEQEKYLESKSMAMMEKRHQQRLNEQAGVVQTYRPLKHTQWYT